VTDDADAIALLESVVQDPFERAPARMHLDGTLEPAVMGILEVGVTPADMGDDHRILALQPLRESALTALMEALAAKVD